jgi:pyruvate/2-oxoglutarate dehydrogenase complex dihydrolipoamide acyltransferase (E2) component
MSGGCFSISSLGGIGGTAFTPIINAPGSGHPRRVEECDQTGVERQGIRPRA